MTTSRRWSWFSVIVCACASLAVLRAPAQPFWILAILVTEWGHWLAAALGLSLTVTPLRRKLGRGGCALFGIAALLCLTPLWRAQDVAARLPGDLIGAFGGERPREMPDAPARSAPLVFLDLWRGIASPPVRKTTYVYAQPDGQSLALDLYRPQHPQTPLPGVLVIHGGSWQSGEKEDFAALDRYLAGRGYAVAAINYRLAPRWTFPAARDDADAALAWLHRHAAELQLADQWVIAGRSAGGQIALSTAYEGRDPSVRGVIALYAPNDLAFAYAIPDNPLIMNSQRVIAAYMGGTPAERPALYAASSPLNAITTRTPPTLMIHGLRDELVWSVHDERLSARLAAARRPHYFLKLPWATHGCDINLAGPSGQLSTYAIERFLAAVLRN